MDHRLYLGVLTIEALTTKLFVEIVVRPSKVGMGVYDALVCPGATC